MTTLRYDRILMTLGLCTAAGACDTFAQSPQRTNQGDTPLPTVRPVPPTPTTPVTSAFNPPPPPATFTPTTTSAPPQNTIIAPAPPSPVALPSSLPRCPPAVEVAASTEAASTDVGSTSVPTASTDGAATSSPLGDGGDTREGSEASNDASATVESSAVEPSASTAVESSQASPAPLPSGDTVLVDDLTLLIVFDNSGSMLDCWDGKTRWEHANHALRAAIEPAQHSLNVGAIRFPADSQCVVEPFESPNQFAFDVGYAFLDAWEAGARYPNGGTPLAAAMIEADKAIQNAADAGLLEERFRVVIITDGEPNCEGSPNLLTTLPRAWRAQGVETRVLGLPGSDGAAALLQDIADAGGGIYEQLTTPGQLHDSAERAAR